MKFKNRYYISQILIDGHWGFLDYHDTVRLARKRSVPLGKLGRVVRVRMEVVKKNEVR